MTLEECNKIAKVKGFYDIPQWYTDEEKPWYYNYYDWRVDESRIIRDYGKDVERLVSVASGFLKDDIFDTIDKKIFYMKGIFESYSGSIKYRGILHFANSYMTVKRCKQFLSDICEEFSIEPEITIKKDVHPGSVPMCNELYLSMEIIDFIQKYKENKD